MNEFTYKGITYKVINGNLYQVTDSCLLGVEVTNDGDLRTIAKANGWTGNIADKVEVFHIHEAHNSITQHVEDVKRAQTRLVSW